ncbi:hypothetical protein FO519_002127 [Halicephalobus sp. NKZ332]|nr:hypothetical protein FO519_002127 [Halicephalobus sp. NKZ332]
MVYDRSRGYETTAIDSGTIWTTERIYTDESRQVTRGPSPKGRDESFVDVGSAGLTRTYDPSKTPIPRARCDSGRQRSEVGDFPICGDGVFFKDLDERGSAEVVDRISDEFRFLNDRPSLPTRINRFYQKKQFSFRYRKPIFIAIGILQMFMAVCLFAFAIIRYKRVYNNPQADILLDFLKAEDFANSNTEGTAIIAMKVGSSLFIPSILQFTSGICGLFPLYKRPPKFLIIINLLLSSLVLKLLFEPIILVAFELNLRNVQLAPLWDNSSYRLLIAVIIIISIMLLFINAASTVHAASQLINSDETESSFLDLHISMVTIVFSVISICFSIFTCKNSLTTVAEWPGLGLRNLAALYGVGLRELLISSFVFFCSIFGSFAAVIKSRSLRFGALVLQIPLLLYIFLLLMTISMHVQLFPIALNIFRKKSYEYYEPSYATPRPLYRPQNIQRSAL